MSEIPPSSSSAEQPHIPPGGSSGGSALEQLLARLDTIQLKGVATAAQGSRLGWEGLDTTEARAQLGALHATLSRLATKASVMQSTSLSMARRNTEATRLLEAAIESTTSTDARAAVKTLQQQAELITGQGNTAGVYKDEMRKGITALEALNSHLGGCEPIRAVGAEISAEIGQTGGQLQGNLDAYRSGIA